MITAVDTSILVDVTKQEEKALEVLSKAAQEGQLIICEMVYAELCAGMEQEIVDQFLQDFGIKYIPFDLGSLSLASQMWRKFIQHHRRQGHILADFFIGAHATIHAERLLSRDRGFYRNYFKDLKLLSYSSHE